MTERNQSAFSCEAYFSRRVVAQFEGGQMTTDGPLLLREAHRKTGLPKDVAGCFTDARDPSGSSISWARCWRARAR